MANTLQILTQIREAMASIGESTSRSQIKSLLDAADVALNTLQLQQSPAFYFQHVAAGRALLEEGSRLARAVGSTDGSKLVSGAELPSAAGLPPGKSAASAANQPVVGNSGATQLAMIPTSATASGDESVDAQIAAIRQSLVAVVEQLDKSRSAEVKRYLVRMSDWETAYYTHNLEQTSRPPEAPGPALTQATLQGYLEWRFPELLDLKITQFSPLVGGFSKRTLLFETDDRVNGRQALVMRAEQPFDLLCYDGSDVTREFSMIRLMRHSGLPTAEPLWLEADPRHLGCRFIVSRKAQGRVYGGALGSDEKLPPALVQSLMATFIQMHNTRIAPGDPLAEQSHLKEWLPYRHSLRETTRYYVSEWLPRLIARTGIPPSPQVERALKWLQANIPESDETPVVMHGDFSFNNLIIGNGGITAVLDWESSRLGDPAEDIIWTQPNIGAYLGMPEFLELYKAGTGRDISAARLAYSRVVKCVLNAVACLSAYNGLETRSDANLNLAILAYKYMGLFGAQFNSLIESAERL